MAWKKNGIDYHGEPLVWDDMKHYIQNPTSADFLRAGYEEYTPPEPTPTREQNTFAWLKTLLVAKLQEIKEAMAGSTVTIADFLRAAYIDHRDSTRNATSESIKAWCSSNGIPFDTYVADILKLCTDLGNNMSTWYKLIEACAPEFDVELDEVQG